VAVSAISADASNAGLEGCLACHQPWCKRGSLQTTGFSIDEVTYTRQAPNAMFNPTHTAMPVHMVIVPSKMLAQIV
jgi:hypothetical protein